MQGVQEKEKRETAHRYEASQSSPPSSGEAQVDSESLGHRWLLLF